MRNPLVMTPDGSVGVMNFHFFFDPGTSDPEAGTDRTQRSKSGVPKV